MNENCGDGHHSEDANDDGERTNGVTNIEEKGFLFRHLYKNCVEKKKMANAHPSETGEHGDENREGTDKDDWPNGCGVVFVIHKRKD